MRAYFGFRVYFFSKTGNNNNNKNLPLIIKIKISVQLFIVDSQGRKNK